ncbi:uncharacterized protein BDV17DRAFT_150696 [Aspergillus undulatus]|uniref:uncharacterized protein n=1 Tax=Aspergillus undulatus TaxID=1810928 RepID=UPI003CCE5151
MKITVLGAVLAAAQSVTAALDESLLETFVDSLELTSSFNPIEEAYWTGYKHHRRTPFAVSPDGESAYLAYLDSSETDIHVQQVNPSTFEAVGTTVTVTGGKEAGGLVAHNDGFALLTNEALPSGTADAPADNTPVPVLYRYTNGEQTWKTWLGGPDVEGADGHLASPDINGDLVYSSEAGLYGAYFVVTAYSGSASGHYGDSIQYVNDDGELQTIDGATSTWGCSHNTGIAFEEASDAPFASICAEDQGAIWLNTNGQGMMNIGVKISNENTTNGASGEPMGGMGGSYSALVKLGSSSKYLFAWPSRGAVDVTTNDWMGEGYTHVLPRNLNRNVAIALFSDKNTLVGDQATSEVGAADGDSQINWVTEGSADHSNVHAAAFGTENVLLTWEQIDNPTCDEFIAMGCKGAFSGTYFQQVDSSGATVGSALNSSDVYVAGDMVNIGDRICWPYVSMVWDLEGTVNSWGGESTDSTTKKISFACIGLSGSGSGSASATASASGSGSATASGTATATGTATGTVTDSLSLTASETAETQVASEPTTDATAVPTTEVAAVPTSVDAIGASATEEVPAAAATSAKPGKGKGKGKCRAHYRH